MYMYMIVAAVASALVEFECNGSGWWAWSCAFVKDFCGVLEDFGVHERFFGRAKDVFRKLKDFSVSLNNFSGVLMIFVSFL